MSECDSHSVMSNSLWYHDAPLFMELSRQEYWVDCCLLLQGIFLTKGLSLGLLHCRQILYYLSEQGNPWQHLSPIILYNFLIFMITDYCPLTILECSVQFSCSVMSDSAIPWTAACQASLSITNSRSLLKLMSIKLVMPSKQLICLPFFSCFQSFPASESFPMSQFLALICQIIEISASASVFSVNIQD